MKPTFSNEAEADLLGIGAYIARENPARAWYYVDEIIRRCDEVAENPELYRLREEWGGTTRAARFGQFLIIFRQVEGKVLIVRVVRGSRDIATILKETR